MENSRKHIDSNTLILGDLNTPLSTMDRSSKQRIKKVILALNDTLYVIDLFDIDKKFHPREAKFIFFSNLQGIIFKDRPHDRAQNRPQQIQEN